MASPPTLQPGAVLAGRYHIMQVLGEGGMGAVYKARDMELDRLVALKVIRPELAGNPSILQRFKQELILARQVTHRNVVRIYDMGEDLGVKFITMEFVEGEDLHRILATRGKLPPSEAVGIMQQVLRALAAAHAETVVHRDLKPQNIMRDSSGRILVMDFGLARTVDSTGMTQTGALVGTVDYMSPEQSLGKELDERSDLFSAGLIFYEMLTGQMPYKADSAIASLMRRNQERAIPASQVDAAVPEPLSAVVSKCLERDLDQRYQKATDILNELDAWTGGRRVSRESKAQLTPSPSPAAAGESDAGIAGTQPPGRAAPRSRWGMALVIVAVVAAGAMAGYFWRRSRVVRQAPHAAISVLVADFANHTGEPVFDGTVEPAFNVAMEGASFINAYNRGTARKLARKLPTASDKLDEQSARLVALSEGVSVVITGELTKSGNVYRISGKALDAVKGTVIAEAQASASDKDDVLRAIPKVAAPMRTALGDTTPESVQIQNAGGAFTVTSLEAVHQYGNAMDQQFAGKMEEALQSFSNAVKLDPAFARAYSGMAVAYRNLGQLDQAKKYMAMAMAHLDRLTERERYRVRGTYYSLEENWPKGVEEYSELVTRYPADNIGHNNLAYCYSHLRNLPKSVEQAQIAVDNQPNAAGWRVNLSLFSSYAGDFQKGESEARKVQELNPKFEYGYIALAFAQLGQGQLSEAAETYHKLEKVSPFGASWSASGLADLAVYEGRFSEAERILQAGAADDEKAKNPDAVADKYATLAYIHHWLRHKGPAIAAAEKALASSQSPKIRFLAARIFAEEGETAKAKKLAAGLSSELSPESQAYGKTIEAEVAMHAGDARYAIHALTEANQLLDTWIGRFDLGRAYLQAGAFAEADSEFDRCMRRRGESLALFLDEAPSYGYFPPIYYFRGRVREGLKSAGFAEPYRTYLAIRGQAGEDPLLPEIRGRVQ